MVAKMFGDPDMADTLKSMMAMLGLSGEPADLDAAQKKALVATMLEFARRKKADGQAPPPSAKRVDPNQIPDALVEQVFADPDMRAPLAGLMGMLGFSGAPEDLDPVKRKALVAAVLDRGRRQGAQEGGPTGDAPTANIPDALVAQVFGDPDMEGPIRRLMGEVGLSGEPQDLTPPQKKALVAVMVKQAEAAKTRAGDGADGPSDALVRQIFADPDAQDVLRQVMAQNSLDGAPADLPFDLQRQIVKALIDAGVIQTDAA